MQEIHEDVVVEDFDSDVSIQTRGDEPGDAGEDVPNGLPTIWRDAMVGKLIPQGSACQAI